MKNLFLVFALLFSTGALASTATVNPTKPIVITADMRSESGEWIQAPWIRADFKIDASETITITGVQFTVKGGGYTQQFTFQLQPGGVEITGGTSYTLPLNYLSQLGPKGIVDFSIHAQYLGWVGSANAPASRLNLSNDFITQ